MTTCDHVAPLLAAVADGDAAPGESARVARHIETCTCCAILLARERRLSEAIEALCDVEIDPALCDTVMALLPAKLPRRQRDRRGLRLASIAGLVALATTLTSGSWRGWGGGIPSGAAPSLPADIADPAAGSILAFAQMIWMALQSAVQAPLLASASVPTLLWVLIAVGSLLAATAFGSTLVAVYFLRAGLPKI